MLSLSPWVLLKRMMRFKFIHDVKELISWVLVIFYYVIKSKCHDVKIQSHRVIESIVSLVSWCQHLAIRCVMSHVQVQGSFVFYTFVLHWSNYGTMIVVLPLSIYVLPLCSSEVNVHWKKDVATTYKLLLVMILMMVLIEMEIVKSYTIVVGYTDVDSHDILLLTLWYC